MRRVVRSTIVVAALCSPLRKTSKKSSKQQRVKSKQSQSQGWVDLAEQDANVDVEVQFHEAMNFLKQPSSATHLERDAADTLRSNDVRVFGIDGYRIQQKADSDHRSRFDEGSFDIRSNRADNDTRRHDGSGDERDILRLSGVSAKRHRDLVDVEENRTSPSDPTLVDQDPHEDSKKPSDTPCHVTDMLRERLMELKAEKIKDNRNETYLPKRLPFADSLRKPSPSTILAPTNNFSDRTLDETRQKTLSELVLHDAESLLPGKNEYDPFAHFTVSNTHSQGGFGMDVLGGAKPANFSLPSPLSTGNETNDGSVLLLRTLQRASMCSRRESIELISSGEVTLDGVVERNPFRRVVASNDIKIKGHPQRLRFSPPRLWMYNKPANVIVSRYDPAGRALITKHARILGMEHLVPIGSLPMKAHGVILLTNDGELCRFLDHPGALIQRTYSFRVSPAIDPVLAYKLNSEGVRINGAVHRNMEFVVNPAAKSRFQLKLKMRGETIPAHQILHHIGRQVKRGGRVSFGPFALGGLATGSIREVTVPPFYMKHVGEVWRPFVERDWPYFRQLRLKRLTRLAKFRELQPKELEELDAFTYEEMSDALRTEQHELNDEQTAHLRGYGGKRPQVEAHELDPFSNELTSVEKMLPREALRVSQNFLTDLADP